MVLFSRINPLIRKRPDLFILGFQKCGTTSLYKCLEDVGFAYPGLRKENDILAWNPTNISKFLSKYPLIWQTKKSVVCGSHLLGTSDNGPQVLSRNFSKSKLLFILRNPAHRALSRYLDNKRKPQKAGNTDRAFNQNFRDLIKIESANIPSDFSGNRKELNALHPTNKLYGGILAKGHYHVYLKEFLQTHDTKVIFLEDLSQDFNAVMSKVFEWLEWDTCNMHLEEKKFNKNDYHLHEYIDELTVLHEYYVHANLKLSELLNRPTPGSWSP